MPPRKPAQTAKPRAAHKPRAAASDAAAILDALARVYPDAACALRFRNPFELLAATILSAQCTDERVNMVTPALFRKYPDAHRLAAAHLEDVEALIQSTGFFRNKARSLVGMARTICEHHGGEVPRTLDELVKLPGVGRKTANVVLGNCFGVPGLTVDTHMQRVNQRLGLTRHTDPEKIERDLMALIPEEQWTIYSHRVIDHGRQVCHARKPQCGVCPLAAWCAHFQKYQGVVVAVRPKRR